MFHSNTEQLIDYWRARRGADAAPRRAAFDPTELLYLMPQLFMLGRQGPGRFNFRLVGGFVGDLHDRDLRQASFLQLWRAEDRASLQMAIETVRRRPEPLVVSCEAHAQTGAAMGMEVTVAPLMAPGGEVDRFIGLYQPTSPVAELMDRPALALSMRAMAMPESENAAFPRLRLAAARGARIA
jgi:hypothetical protein